MATKTKRRSRGGRAVQTSPPKLKPKTLRPWMLVAVGVIGLAALAAAAIVIQVGGGTSDEGGGGPATAGLPNTSDYHSLLVSTRDPEELVLGTHQGLYHSFDGGRSWSAFALSGQDAMNLVRPSQAIAWVAGHNVLAKSADGSQTWTDVRPSGLPSLDVHGFAFDPRSPRTLYAAIAGRGLYRSDDGGDSFAPVSTDVGPNVMALAVLRDGRILAGDMERGLLGSRDHGRTWDEILNATVLGLAVNPTQPDQVLAAGQGVFLSRDGARTWRRVLDISEGAGPVAWSPNEARVAWVVGFDRRLYRSGDGGKSWSAVQ
jgi:photosystem II stability/assembly factor-like uncharacterized protein